MLADRTRARRFIGESLYYYVRAAAAAVIFLMAYSRTYARAVELLRIIRAFFAPRICAHIESISFLAPRRSRAGNFAPERNFGLSREIIDLICAPRGWLVGFGFARRGCARGDWAVFSCFLGISDSRLWFFS